MIRQSGSRPAVSANRQAKARVKSPGFTPSRDGGMKANAAGALVDLAERLAHAALDRLGGLGRDLLRQRAELLALRGERFELLARVRAGELDHFRQRLRRHDLAGEI